MFCFLFLFSFFLSYNGFNVPLLTNGCSATKHPEVNDAPLLMTMLMVNKVLSRADVQGPRTLSWAALIKTTSKAVAQGIQGPRGVG